MGKQSTQSGGIGLGMILFLIFMILKLTHYIDWSWWYVTMPLWGGAILMLLVVFIIVILASLFN